MDSLVLAQEYGRLIPLIERIRRASDVVLNQMDTNPSEEIRARLRVMEDEMMELIEDYSQALDVFDRSSFAQEYHYGVLPEWLQYPEGWENICYSFRRLQDLAKHMMDYYDECLDILGIELVEDDNGS